MPPPKGNSDHTPHRCISHTWPKSSYSATPQGGPSFRPLDDDKVVLFSDSIDFIFSFLVPSTNFLDSLLLSGLQGGIVLNVLRSMMSLSWIRHWNLVHYFYVDLMSLTSPSDL